MAVDINKRYQSVDTEGDRKMKEHWDSMSKKEKVDEMLPGIMVSSYITGAGAGTGFALGGVPGAAVGASIGSTFGIVAGAAGYAVSHFSKYNQWLKKYKVMEVFNELRQFHQDHEAYKDYCDPITLELLRDPVRSPYGHVYNRSTIDQLVDDDGLIKDPFRNPSYSYFELVDAREVLEKLWEADVQILKEELENEQISPGVKAGLEAFIEGLEKAVEQRKRFRENQRASQLAAEKVSKLSCQIM